MAGTRPKGAYDLSHQQSDVIDYITEIAQELASMAARAGCDTLSHDLKQAILKAHGMGEKSHGNGNKLAGDDHSHNL